MNRSLIVAVLTVTMIVMMSTAGYALVGVHNLYCDNCHSRHTDPGGGAKAATIGCIGCHSVSGMASRQPIDADAMSNIFGSYTTADQPLTGSKSTHNYLSLAPWNPKAKVQEPTNTSLNSGNGGVSYVNKIYCGRCHGAHANYNDTPDVNKPFLRVTNVDDAMCKDCHRTRNQTDVNTGTHPVAYRAYSTVYKLNTTAFRKVPLSPNPNNRTAMLGSYLKSGKIVCSTCHATHYADSNSATLDNRSTANGFAVDDPSKGLKGQLQPSNGELLRTDRFGATADSINVCSSCHKETKNLNHNANGQNIQCDHCHGAHVDYTTEGIGPNRYLVRRDFSNMSTAKVKLGSNKKVIFVNSTGFMRADGKGICQVCHTPTPGVAIHDVANTTKADCLVCHKHSNGFSAASCTNCHGQPPEANYVGGPNGKASQNYSLDESFTPHAIHAGAGFYKYACKNCHYDGTKQGYHNTGTGTFTDVFVDTTGSVGNQLGFTNVPADYNSTAKTCANVYCHSNGNPRTQTGNAITWKSATTLGWELGKGKIVGQSTECSSCHEYGNTLTTNSHSAHVTSVGIKCYVCHNATTSVNGGISDRTKHANGTKDVTFVARPDNYNGLFTATFTSADASCTNSCHGSATPVWTLPATGACGSCHGVPATTGAHTLHFTGTTGPKLGTDQSVCVTCHDNTGNGKHANGQIDVVTSCSPCHPGAAVWTNAASVTCQSCHVGTASVVGSYIAPLKFSNATGHGKYALSSQCTACHDATKNHIGAGPTEKRLLIAGNALCDSCHTTAAGKGLPEARTDLLVHGGTVNAFTHYTTADLANIAAVRADACSGCHDTHGSTNLFSIRTVINGQTVTFTNTSTGFRVTQPNGNGVYNGLCQVCHTKVKYFRNNAAPDLNHNFGRNCLDCHSHKGMPTALYAFAPNGDCNTCHGYPPVKSMTGFGTAGNYLDAKLQDYSGGGGAHSVAGHLPMTIVKADNKSACLNCHFDFDNSHNQGQSPVNKNFVNVVVNPNYKFNNASTIVYTGNSCSNVSCHFKPSPNWVTGN